MRRPRSSATLFDQLVCLLCKDTYCTATNPFRNYSILTLKNPFFSSSGKGDWRNGKNEERYVLITCSCFQAREHECICLFEMGGVIFYLRNALKLLVYGTSLLHRRTELICAFISEHLHEVFPSSFFLFHFVVCSDFFSAEQTNSKEDCL